MKIEVFQSPSSGEFYFRLKAANGQIVLSSQSYQDQDGAVNGAQSVINNAANAENYKLQEAKNGKHYFNLVAANGQIIGRSQMYASSSGAKRGIDAVMKAAANAEIVNATDIGFLESFREAGSWINFGDGSIPPDVLKSYVDAVAGILEHIDVRTDTPQGKAIQRYGVDLNKVRGDLSGGVSSRDGGGDDGFDCFGSIGTFGTYGGTLGTAGTFGCGDPDDIDISLCGSG